MKLSFDTLENRRLCDVGGANTYINRLEPIAVAPLPDVQLERLPDDPTATLTQPVPDPSDSHMTILLTQTKEETVFSYPLMPTYYIVSSEAMDEYMMSMNPYGK